MNANIHPHTLFASNKQKRTAFYMKCLNSVHGEENYMGGGEGEEGIKQNKALCWTDQNLLFTLLREQDEFPLFSVIKCSHLDHSLPESQASRLPLEDPRTSAPQSGPTHNHEHDNKHNSKPLFWHLKCDRIIPDGWSSNTMDLKDRKGGESERYCLQKSPHSSLLQHCQSHQVMRRSRKTGNILN